MKKYFIKETDEVLEYGDVLELGLVKEVEGGHITCEKEIKFLEGMEDFLLDLGVIEEREVDDDLLDFEDEERCHLLDALCEDFEILEERVDKMEGVINEIYELITNSLKEEKKKSSKKVNVK